MAFIPIDNAGTLLVQGVVLQIDEKIAEFFGLLYPYFSSLVCNFLCRSTCGNNAVK